MNVLSYSEARSRLRQVIEDTCRDHEPTILTRQRGESVVMISLEDYNGMLETLDILKSPANAERMRESLDQLRAGDFTSRELIKNVQEHGKVEEG